MSQFDPKKILVIKHGSLGDIVFALEPILAIKKKFNNTVIDLVTEEKFISFFKKMNMFQQFLIDNRKGFFATIGLINKIIFGKYICKKRLGSRQRLCFSYVEDCSTKKA